MCFWFHWSPSKTVTGHLTNEELIQWTLSDSLEDLYGLDVV